MNQVYALRHRVLKERQGIRRVARELGFSRNTISHLLDQSEPIRSSRRKRGERPVWEAVQLRLEELVSEWERRTTANQRITRCGFIVDSLEAISRQLLAEPDAAFPARHRAERSVSELPAEERVRLLLAPAMSFEVRMPIPVEISSRAMVKIEQGAWILRAVALGAARCDRVPRRGRRPHHLHERERDASAGAVWNAPSPLSPLSARASAQAARGAPSGARIDHGVGRTVEWTAGTVVRNARRTSRQSLIHAIRK